MKYYSRDERERREVKRDELTTAIIRFICGCVSLGVIVLSIFLITSNDKETQEEDDSSGYVDAQIVLALGGLFTLTTVIAVRGDKALPAVRKMLEDDL